MALSATILLIGKLGTILENERTTIAGVRGEVDKIKLELQYMKAFIEDEEANNKIQTEVEKMRFASIRDLAYDAGDIIDEFMYHMYEKQSGGRISRVLHKTIHAPNNLWFRRKTAKKLQKITEKIKDSADRHRRYIDGRGATKSDGIHILVRNLADYSYSMMEEEVVGIEGKKQLLMRWLMDEEQHRTVTSVVGMGGSGKTTLVANTFKNERIKRHFDFCAWITVSQTYVVADLFRSLIMEIYKSRQEDVPANLSSMSSRDLIEIVTSYLEFKRYLVVLDDVWDIEVWEGIKVSLQDRQNGSRIVLTTRNEEVVPNSFGVGSHVHHIQPLQRNEAGSSSARRHSQLMKPKLVHLS